MDSLQPKPLPVDAPGRLCRVGLPCCIGTAGTIYQRDSRRSWLGRLIFGHYEYAVFDRTGRLVLVTNDFSCAYHELGRLR